MNNLKMALSGLSKPGKMPMKPKVQMGQKGGMKIKGGK